MLTTRDIEIKEFLNTYKIATTSTIQHFFFPSDWSCYKRLKYLTDKKVVKRIRDNVSCEYIYYLKCPKQLKHSLLVTEFYKELSKQSEVINFKIEPDLGSIQPDAIFGYIKNGKKCLGVLEVEISNKGFNSAKYQKFLTSNEYKNYFPVFPILFIVSTKSNNISIKGVKGNMTTITDGLRIPLIL